MLKWLWWHLPRITSQKNIVKFHRIYEDKFYFVLKELKEIRRTCHKKEQIDSLIKELEYWF